MLDHLTDWARVLQLFMQATLVACFFHWKVARNYRWFTGYIFTDLIRSCLLFGFDPHRILYAEIWSLTQPVLWIFQIGAVVELMSLVSMQRQTNGSLIQRLFSFYLPSAVLASVVVSLYESLDSAPMSWWLHVAMSITKWLAWISLFLLVAQELLHLTESASLPREVLIHRRLLILYVGAIPGILAILVFLPNRQIANVANLCCEISWILCLFFWLALFRPSRHAFLLKS